MYDQQHITVFALDTFNNIVKGLLNIFNKNIISNSISKCKFQYMMSLSLYL